MPREEEGRKKRIIIHTGNSVRCLTYDKTFARHKQKILFKNQTRNKKKMAGEREIMQNDGADFAVVIH